MKQKAAAGKAPASKPIGGKPSTLGPAGSKPVSAGPSVGKPSVPGLAGKPPIQGAVIRKPGPGRREPGAGQSTALVQKKSVMDAATLHNRERQRNKTNERFWKGRGYEGRPEDWQTVDPDAAPKKS